MLSGGSGLSCQSGGGSPPNAHDPYRGNISETAGSKAWTKRFLGWTCGEDSQVCYKGSLTPSTPTLSSPSTLHCPHASHAPSCFKEDCPPGWPGYV